MTTPDIPVQETDEDISDWAGSPLSTLHHMEPTPQPIPVEEYLDGDRYMIRFELPGVDPGKDLDVSVQAQVLTVHAQKRPAVASRSHSQFRYGEFCSHITMPAGIDATDISATCQNGVLEVSAGYEAQQAARKIEIGITSEQS